MINTKQTLKNLHKKFPMMSLDELFEVLDCYVEESYLNITPTNDPWKTLPTVSKPSIWYDNQVTSISSKDLNSDSHIIATNGDIGISTRKF